MDANLDGEISLEEMINGFKAMHLGFSDDEVAAFFRSVEPAAGATQTTLKKLQKALRPKVLQKRPEDLAAEAAGAEIGAADMVTDGMTEEQVAQMRAEAHLNAGRLPSLSPDEDDEGGGGGGTKGGGKGGRGGAEEVDGAVWSQMESRIAPDGIDAAPDWQRRAAARAVARRREAARGEAIGAAGQGGGQPADAVVGQAGAPVQEEAPRARAAPAAVQAGGGAARPEAAAGSSARATRCGRARRRRRRQRRPAGVARRDVDVGGVGCRRRRRAGGGERARTALSDARSSTTRRARTRRGCRARRSTTTWRRRSA